MGKFWSVIFLLVPILGVATFVVAPYYNIWLPRDISHHGRTIDHLFYFILWLTGVVFVATEVAMFWFLWRYDGAQGQKRTVKFTHGSHTLEVVWTILPAATLLFIAIYQMNAWADSKIRTPRMTPTVEVAARQFEWRLRYPGPDGKFDTLDDIHVVNDLHLPVNEDVLVGLTSKDVLHSFFLPNMRVKQDAVPGMLIPVWFRPIDTGEFDLVCAELCGWGHYKMRGRLTIESREDFNRWLAQKYAAEQATQDKNLPAASTGDAE